MTYLTTRIGSVPEFHAFSNCCYLKIDPYAFHNPQTYPIFKYILREMVGILHAFPTVFKLHNIKYNVFGYGAR